MNIFKSKAERNIDQSIEIIKRSLYSLSYIKKVTVKRLANAVEFSAEFREIGGKYYGYEWETEYTYLSDVRNVLEIATHLIKSLDYIKKEVDELERSSNRA